MDKPFWEVVGQAEGVIAKGGSIYQKFTCGKCGSRQTMEKKNALFTSGVCEECEHETDLTEKGCGLLVVVEEKGGVAPLFDF